MVDQSRLDATLAAIDEQLADFEAMVQEGTPDRVPRWQRVTAEVLANYVSTAEADDFRRSGQLRQMPRYGQRVPPFAHAGQQNEFLKNLRADIVKSPDKHLGGK